MILLVYMIMAYLLVAAADLAWLLASLIQQHTCS